MTLHDEAGYQVANPLNRFAVSSWMLLRTTPTVRSTCISGAKPRPASKLGCRADGPFSLTMRITRRRLRAIVGNCHAAARHTCRKVIVGSSAGGRPVTKLHLVCNSLSIVALVSVRLVVLAPLHRSSPALAQ